MQCHTGEDGDGDDDQPGFEEECELRAMAARHAYWQS